MDSPQYAEATSPFERFLLSSSNDLLNAFFAVWPVDLIFRIRRLSTVVFCAIEAYRVRTWHPIHVLQPFFSDSFRSFLNTLDKCDGVVSGSQVVQLLQRRPFTDRGSDLDIFIPRHGLLAMGRWLKRNGYVYQASTRKHVLFDVEAIRSASIALGFNHDGSDVYPTSREAPKFSTYHFIRRFESPDTVFFEEAKYFLVQLVVVDTQPVQYIINNFHSSKRFNAISLCSVRLLAMDWKAGVMNWFTGKHIVSLFPRSTFVDRISYSCRDTNRSGKAWIRKYSERGFEVVVGGGIPSKASKEIEAWDRYVGDAFTWVMPIGVPGINSFVLRT